MPTLALTVRRLVRRMLETAGWLGPFYRARERQIAAQAGTWPAVAADGLPSPTPLMVTTVVGNTDLDGFLREGREIAAFLSALAARHGGSLSEGQVLDFGCGCGCLARVLAPGLIASGGGYTGCDINESLVHWCAGALPGRYLVNALAPPAPVADQTVDVLFAISVLTHMPRERMGAWLADFHRVLKPGGLALVSFADEARAELADRDRPGAALAPRLRRDGFATSTRTLEGSNFMSSYATVAAFTAMAGQVFEVLEVAPSPRTDQALAWSVLRRR